MIKFDEIKSAIKNNVYCETIEVVKTALKQEQTFESLFAIVQTSEIRIMAVLLALVESGQVDVFVVRDKMHYKLH